MQVSAQYAFAHFDDIASAVDRGEPVEIVRSGKPALQLVPAPTPEPKAARRILGAGRGELRIPSIEKWQAMDAPSHSPAWSTPERPRAELFGCLKGKFRISADWDSPETNQQIADLFEQSSIFPDLPLA